MTTARDRALAAAAMAFAGREAERLWRFLPAERRERVGGRVGRDEAVKVLSAIVHDAGRRVTVDEIARALGPPFGGGGIDLAGRSVAPAVARWVMAYE